MEKRYLIYGIIVIVCIVSLGIGFHDQIYGKEKTSPFSSSQKQLQQSEEAENLRENFLNIFTNSLTYETAIINSSANIKDKTKEVVYTANELKETVSGKYQMNINVPELNIASSLAQQINEDIDEQFVKTARNILKEQNIKNTIYNINYVAYVNSNIVSLVVQATLKEENTAQITMIKTYNYNLNTGELVKINDLLKMKNISVSTLQNEINKRIKEENKNAEGFNKQGYQFFTRNLEDSMYKVQNTEYFFLGSKSHLYVIYPYGNNSSNNTSDVDVVVI